MKVLLAHNYYRSDSPSGEDVAFENEWQMLTDHGVEVVRYERFNDDLADTHAMGKLKAARNAVWSDRTYAELSRLLTEVQPDVAHFHNTFPLISPSGYQACYDQCVPVVQTLHNFRLVCPGGMLMRDGKPCEQCVGGSLVPSLIHRCYRDSLMATAVIVWMLAKHRARGSYERLVDKYIVLTEFAAKRLRMGGIPPERIEIKPNSIPSFSSGRHMESPYAVYVGRLSIEKGVHILIKAWSDVKGLGLKIIGDGPMRRDLETSARQQSTAIKFLGRQDHDEVLRLIGGAHLLILPSLCYENFPLSILEAFACGIPVVASRLGSMDEIVQENISGRKFSLGSATDLARVVNELGSDNSERQRLGVGARQQFEDYYAANRNISRLMEIYDSAITDRHGGKCVRVQTAG
jgi:glycosyltransferase involved in cell wall biosynthesis